MKKPQIVIIDFMPQTRTYKHLMALSKFSKYDVILVTRHDINPVYKQLASKVVSLKYDQRIRDKFRKSLNIKILNNHPWFQPDPSILKEVMTQFSPDLFQVNTGYFRENVGEFVLNQTKKPVVMHATDFTGISFGLENLPKKIVASEKYCLENCHGIIRKGPEYEIDYYRQHGYEINCPELQWLDYCNPDLFSDEKVKKLSEMDKEIHIVYTGTITSVYPYNNYVPIGKYLADKRIHLHIYPNVEQGSFPQSYIDMANQSKYFHIHQSLPYEDLLKEIAHYDWGLWIHPVYDNPNMPRATTDKFKVSIGNKLFTYLEAGLPVMVSDHLEFGKQIINEFSIGCIVKDTELPIMDEKINELNYSMVQKNVMKTRQELSITNKVTELDEFYHRIADSKSAN